MTGFDFIVLGIVAIAAIGGFLRGFVQEVFSLAAWIFAGFAIRYIHTPLTLALAKYMGMGVSTAILAFALLLLIPYAAMKVIANNLGQSARNSALAPIDRVLGFGFGGIKGVVVVIVAFSLLVLGYDTVWGFGGRPSWITTARSYDLVDGGSRSLVEIIAERRSQVRAEQPVAEKK